MLKEEPPKKESSFGNPSAAAVAGCRGDVEEDDRKDEELEELFWRLDPEESFSDFAVSITNLQTGATATYHAHKAQLALGKRRSEYFAACLRDGGNFAERRGEVSISLEGEAAEAFPTFLDYLYAGRLGDISTEEAIALLHLGGYFRVARLLQEMEQHVLDRLKPETLRDLVPLIIKFQNDEGMGRIGELAQHLVAESMMLGDELDLMPLASCADDDDSFGRSVFALCGDVIGSRELVDGNRPHISPKAALRIVGLCGGAADTPLLKLCFDALWGMKINAPNTSLDAASALRKIPPERLAELVGHQLQKSSDNSAEPSSSLSPNLYITLLTTNTDLSGRFDFVPRTSDFGDYFYRKPGKWKGTRGSFFVYWTGHEWALVFRENQNVPSRFLYLADTGGVKGNGPPSWGWKRAGTRVWAEDAADSFPPVLLKFCESEKKADE